MTRRSPRCGRCTAGSRSCPPSGSRASSTSSWWESTWGRRCGGCSTPGSPRSSSPSFRRWRSNRTRYIATRMSWRTRLRSSRRPRRSVALRLAALFHDIGKPATRRFEAGGVTFHHHEVVGARMTRDRMSALRYSKQVTEDVSRLVFLHMRPHTYKMGWTDSAVRRYVRDAGPLLASAQRTRALRRHDAQRQACQEPSAAASTSSRCASMSSASWRSSTRCGPRSTATRSLRISSCNPDRSSAK